jgi:hypothetical protein
MCPHCAAVAIGALAASIPALRYGRGWFEERRARRARENANPEPDHARREGPGQGADEPDEPEERAPCR